MDHREILQVGEGTRQLLLTREACPALSRHGVRMAGLTQARGVLWRRRDWPETLVLHCLAGRAEAWVDGAFRRLAPGLSYIVPARAYHAYHDADDLGWFLVWVYLAEEGRHRRTGPAEPFVREADGRPLQEAVRACHHELYGPAQAELIESWVAIIAMLARRFAASKRADDPLGALWQQVAGDPARAWSLSDLATRSGLGIEVLRRRCQRQHGCSPMAMVTRLRLRQAAGLLAAGHGPVAQIAAAVGYGNPAAFAAAFRRWSGRQPSALRS